MSQITAGPAGLEARLGLPTAGALYTLTPPAHAGAPAVMTAPGSRADSSSAAVMLQPFAAGAGSLMTQTYRAMPSQQQPSQPQGYGFGPFTNANVVAVDAVAAPCSQCGAARAVAASLPWGIPNTAIGYVAGQDAIDYSAGVMGSLPSWPGNSHLTAMGTWTASPWEPLPGCPSAQWR